MKTKLENLEDDFRSYSSLKNELFTFKKDVFIEPSLRIALGRLEKVNLVVIQSDISASVIKYILTKLDSSLLDKVMIFSNSTEYRIKYHRQTVITRPYHSTVDWHTEMSNQISTKLKSIHKNQNTIPNILMCSKNDYYRSLCNTMKGCFVSALIVPTNPQHLKEYSTASTSLVMSMEGESIESPPPPPPPPCL
jgi:hypothetical protein